MKKLIIFGFLLFTSQFALADLAGDLANGVDIATAVQNAANAGESNESIAAALQSAGIADIAAVNAMTQAGVGLGAAINAVSVAYGVDPNVLVNNLTAFNLRIGEGEGAGDGEGDTSGSGARAGSAGAGGGGGGGGGSNISPT